MTALRGLGTIHIWTDTSTLNSVLYQMLPFSVLYFFCRLLTKMEFLNKLQSRNISALLSFSICTPAIISDGWEAKEAPQPASWLQGAWQTSTFFLHPVAPRGSVVFAAKLHSASTYWLNPVFSPRGTLQYQNLAPNDLMWISTWWYLCTLVGTLKRKKFGIFV